MIKLNLQFFGGRGSSAGKRSGESNTKSSSSTTSSSAESLVAKIAAMKNGKSAGKYFQTAEQRAEVLSGIKKGDLVSIDYNDGKGIGVLVVQRVNSDTYYIGEHDNMAQGNLKQVTAEMERRLKGHTTTGRGAFISRGWDEPQNVPYDFNPEGTTPKTRVILRPERIKKLKGGKK